MMQLLGHFKTLMGPYGIYQHATKKIPLLREGYCTDDNARAITLLLYLKKSVSPEHQAEIDQLIAHCWQFIIEARMPSGEYYNFRAADGQWLEHEPSEDMYARLLRALVTVMHHDTHNGRRQQARAMLVELMPQVRSFHAPRAWGESLVAFVTIPEPLATEAGIPAVVEQGVEQLSRLWEVNSTAQWPWFETTMTYANALLPHGLLAALQAGVGQRDVLTRATDFLIATTTSKGTFMPIGSNGWYPKGGTPSHDNQQAIEAGTMLDFMLDYESAFPGALSPETQLAPYLWFFGKNTHRLRLIDPTDGACYDGLFDTGPNQNCGAESLLAYLWAEVRMMQAPLSLRTQAKYQKQQYLPRG